MERLTPLQSNTDTESYPDIINGMTIEDGSCIIFQSENKSRQGVIVSTLSDGSEITLFIIDRRDDLVPTISFDEDGLMDDETIITNNLNSLLNWNLNDANPLAELEIERTIWLGFYNNSGSDVVVKVFEKG